MAVGIISLLQLGPRIQQWDPSAESWGRDLCLNMGPESETGSRLARGDRVAVHRDSLSGLLGAIQRVGALCFW
jgi:hypothetical protein